MIVGCRASAFIRKGDASVEHRPSESSPVSSPVEVRIVSIDLPFAELLLVALKLLGVQAVLAVIIGLIYLALR